MLQPTLGYLRPSPLHPHLPAPQQQIHRLPHAAEHIPRCRRGIVRAMQLLLHQKQSLMVQAPFELALERRASGNLGALHA